MRGSDRMETPSPRESNIRRAHPLAVALAQRLREDTYVRILEVGKGSGRNTDALAAAGFLVESIPEGAAKSFSVERASFDAALSTHALLHGTPQTVAEITRAIALALKPDAPFYATYASKRDVRYGKGTRVAEDAFAPDEGDERGVAHAYFDEAALRRIIDPLFELESLEEHVVDDVVGSWAHAQRPQGSVHWFAIARRRRTR